MNKKNKYIVIAKKNPNLYKKMNKKNKHIVIAKKNPKLLLIKI